MSDTTYSTITSTAESVIVSCFPGIGKSYLQTLYPDFVIDVDCVEITFKARGESSFFSL